MTKNRIKTYESIYQEKSFWVVGKRGIEKGEIQSMGIMKSI